MPEELRAVGPQEELLAALHDALAAESDTVTVDAEFVDSAIRRCRRGASLRASTVRLAAPLLVVAVLVIGVITGGELRPASTRLADPNHSAQSVPLTGPAIRLSGFKVPTPVHYTPSEHACGLRTARVYAVSAAGSACLQVSLMPRSPMLIPRGADWVLVGRNRAVLVHRGDFTRLMVIVPASPRFRLFVVSATSLSDRDLLALARQIVPSEGR